MTNMQEPQAKPVDDSALLASLGYKQELKREFTAIELFGFGFSVSAIVPSVASVLAFSLPNGGPSAMIWGVRMDCYHLHPFAYLVISGLQWATASVFLMFIAMAMAELASSAPTSGGLYYWTYKFSSPRTRNLLCWIVGYTNTISYITGLAGSDWSCAVLIMAGATIGSNGAFVPTLHQTFGVFCAVVISHAIVASCATKFIARIQYLFIAINLALVLVMIIGLPSATPAEFKNSAKYAFGNFVNLTPWPNGYAFVLSFLSPLWSIGGFDLGVHISEEARNASVTVPWAILSVTAISCILGFAIQISVAFCMGTDTLGILSSPIQQPMATILLNSFGRRGMLAVWSLMFIALYMAGVSLLTSGSRQVFAFSRDGALPLSSFLYKINSVMGTPVRCVWLSAISALLLGCITFAGSTATGALFTLGVVGQYMANSIPVAARYFGGQPFKKGPFHLGIFSMPVATIAVLWMWFMTIVLLFLTAPNPSASTMNYTVVVAFGVWFLAIGYYYFPRYGGRYWFEGPVANVETESSEVQSPADEKMYPLAE
ncbi:putative amino-acid permease C11D3.08c [Mycena sanguinolenta]|uniref:Putative amino-acid permease C11D3.08c n=1 Tax=Mycena sanguinolenta TaxID=230812 RepID=A0A8H7DA74_9AGAR|nr:putative amino-acid permease C11D3.08c [Mycena sanguinolenta]